VSEAQGVTNTLGRALDAVAAMLTTALPSLAITATGTSVASATANGRAAGDRVRRALAGEASPDEFRQAMYQLKLVTDDVRAARRSGLPISPEDQAFLSSFYGAVGDRLYDIPAYVKAPEHTWDTSLFGLFGKNEAGFSAADQTTMMNSVGNGVLTLSADNSTLPPAVRDLLNQPATTTSQVIIGPFGSQDMPLAPGREPLTGVFGETNHSLGLHAPNFDKFESLGQMVHAADSDIVPGKDFSSGLTRQTADIADASRRLNDVGRLTPSDPGYFTMTDTPALYDSQRVETAMTNMLDVTTRNHEANAALFDPAVASNRETLTHLANYAWTDDGRTVGQLVDWIGPGMANPAESQLASTAYVNLTQTMTDTSAMPGHFPEGRGALGTSSMFEQMSRSMTTNPELSEALARATVPNLDLYAHPLDGIDTNTRDMQISSPDASRMLTLAQFSQGGRDEIAFGAAAYGQYQLDQAYHGTTGTLEQRMEQAGRYTGNVQGMATATANDAIWYANVDDAEARSREQQLAYERQQAAMKAVKDYAGFGIGKIPGVDSFSSFLAGQAMGSFVDSFKPPTPIAPTGIPFDVSHHPMFSGNASTYEAAYTLANYEHAAGRPVPDSVFVTDAAGGRNIPLPGQVGDIGVKESVVRWATDDPARAAYLAAYDQHASVSYDRNLHVSSRDDIVNFIQGRHH
jgi:hypothetical protein